MLEIEACRLFSALSQTTVKIRIADEGMIPSSVDASSQKNVEPVIVSKPPESIPTDDSYISALLKLEKRSVAGLQSVVKKLKKRTLDSIDIIHTYRREIN